MAGQFYMNKLLQIGGVISIILGVVSVVMLLNDAFNIGWVSPLRRILEYYLWAKSVSVDLLEPFIFDVLNWLLRWTDFNWQIRGHWSDVLILMSLYFSARAKAYWSAGLTGRAIFRVVFGVLIALVFSVASGLIPPADARTNFILATTPILGILMFELVDSAVSATVSRKEGLSWAENFFRYMKFGGPVLLLGIGLVAATCYYAQNTAMASSSVLGLSALLLFAILLTIYWAVRGLAHSIIPENRNPGESVFHRFKRSSNTHIAYAMALTLSGAILWVTMNAGLALIGLEQSTL
jgi:hypothetical protein